MEGTEGITPLENLFNGPAEPSEPTPPVEPSPPEPTPIEPVPTGEPTPPAPPAEEPEDPKVTAFKAKALDEAKKRQRLEQENAEFQRQLAEYQRYLQQIAAQQQQRQQAQQPSQPQQQRPHPSQFNTYEEYEVARDNYVQAIAEEKAVAKAQEVWEANARRAAQLQQQAVIQQQTAADLADMLKAGKEKYPDFEQVVANPNVPVTDTMLNAMMVIDGGHEVSYYLGQNPMEAARIANLPPSSQAREIGKLAKQITAPLQAPVVPVVAPPVAPAPVAAAPAPAVPELPKTLTQTRSAGGQFTKAWTGPTPLDEVVKRKK